METVVAASLSKYVALLQRIVAEIEKGILLCRQSYIMQCHRAFIVNLKQVARVDSRNSGIALVMQYGNDTVLVSKQYSAEVKERIKNPSTIA